MITPTHMTPIEYYRTQCEQMQIVADQQQQFVLDYLQQLHQTLTAEHKRRSNPLARLQKPKSIQGLYLWGGVGAGKTFLMDCLYQCLPFSNKKRIHFHAFMRWMHHELKALQGEKNPLEIIARALAKKYLLLCLDELFVSDIADAMILANVFRALIKHGICLVITSNLEPDSLYKNGLQRPLFLPAIELLKKHTNVIHLTANQDYRLRHLINADVFYTPNDETANDEMDKLFKLLTNHQHISHQAVQICERMIPIIKQCDDAIWFEFDIICNTPRSQHDYLEIAKKYKTVFISNIPIIPATARNTITLFIKLVDIFYDENIRLICSSSAPIAKIYPEGNMAFEFARTCSRLTEMQSEAYFSQSTKQRG